MSILLLAASLVSAPQLSEHDGYQMIGRVFRRIKRDFRATIVLDVDPQGNVLLCRIVQIEGPQSAGSQACDALEDKTLEPASAADGSPSYGRYKMIFSVGDEWRGQALQPDIFLQTGALPEGVEQVDLHLTVTNDADGTVRDCVQQDEVVPAAYGEIACANLQSLPLVQMRDGGGDPVGFVEEVVVRFVLPGTV